MEVNQKVKMEEYERRIKSLENFPKQVMFFVGVYLLLAALKGILF